MTAKLAAIFFLISDSLLWPVMLGLLAGLAVAIWKLGGTAREALERAREHGLRREVADALERNDAVGAAELLRGAKRPLRPRSALATLAELYAAREDPALVEKKLVDDQNRRADRLTVLRLLMKFGPALGLMGTLIPLSPALVGLATGDLESLAQNLGIAFATTVVGLTVSLLAFLATTLEKRWTATDAILTTFAVERVLATSARETDS